MYIKYTTLLASALALTTTTLAAPVPGCRDGSTSTPVASPVALPVASSAASPVASPAASPAAASVAAPGALTAEDLIAIAPSTASCEGAAAPDECADASRAAPAINKGFEANKITAKGEQAALVAYMLYESVNFAFNHNRNPPPGRPGQGTRMMAMPPTIKKYATAVAGAQDVDAAEAAQGDAGLEAVLALVNSDDEKSFGAAPWFLTTCTPDVRAGLVAATVEGWHAFLTQCVGTTATSDRDVSWEAAKKVLGAGA